MKFTISWLKDHLKSNKKDNEIIDKLTNIGLEVESFQKLSSDLDGFKVAKIVNVPIYVLRFWEKKFKQIKPRVLDGKRRYYDTKNIELLKKVHFLLKEKGMTINGAKKALDNQEPLKLDEISNQSIRTENIKEKLVKISNMLKSLKK